MNYRELLEITKQFLKVSGLPVTIFCRKVRCAPSTYYRWRRHETRISYKLARRIRYFLQDCIESAADIYAWRKRVIIIDSFLTAKDTVKKMRNIIDDIPIWQKDLLTIEEGAKFFNIGMNRLRSMADSEDSPFFVHVGSKVLIKRRRFSEYLNSDLCYSVWSNGFSML